MPSFYNLQRRRQTTGRQPRPRFMRPGPEYFQLIAQRFAIDSEIAAVLAALSVTFGKPVYGKYKNWSKSQLQGKLSRLRKDRNEL